MFFSYLLLIIVQVSSFALALLDDPLRILDTGDEQAMIVRESEKWAIKRRGINFIDITNHATLPWIGRKTESFDVPSYNYPKETTKKHLFQNAASLIDEKKLHDNLAKFTSFFTRYYKSPYGVQSAEWLLSKIQNISRELSNEIVSIDHFEHNGWKQFSIIVRIQGSDSGNDIIVLGSHIDSMNLIFPKWMVSPGADDNGSGTVTILESFRIYVELLKKGYRPKNTVEFHFYSAEEAGLLGSFDIFTKYRKEGNTVVAMLQQDMTGYVSDKKDEHIGLITDYTSYELNEFLKLIANSYLSIPVRESTCGYACSDHGSATKNGFPASFALESTHSQTNKYIHTTMDTIDRLSFSHMKEHVKLTLGFIIELDNWNFQVIDKSANK